MGALLGPNGGVRSACAPVQETAFATLGSVRHFKCCKTCSQDIIAVILERDLAENDLRFRIQFPFSWILSFQSVHQCLLFPTQSFKQILASTLPSVVNPSCLQTTVAALMFQKRLHTVPHTPSKQISILPSNSVWPPTNRISPSVQFSRTK